MADLPILYIKPGCPWCREAKSFFANHGIEVEIRDVTKNFGQMKRMIEVSGQSLTPTFEFGDFVVADFSVDEFKAELDERPDIRLALGLGDHDDEF